MIKGQFAHVYGGQKSIVYSGLATPSILDSSTAKKKLRSKQAIWSGESSQTTTRR
jgi:hypothetical protein